MRTIAFIAFCVFSGFSFSQNYPTKEIRAEAPRIEQALKGCGAKVE